MTRGRGQVRTQQTRWERASDSILYTLAELRLLRWLVVVIPHQPAAIRDPLLEAGDRPADATLRKAKADNCRAVIWVLLLVAHQLQRHCPRPRNGYECEAPRAEDCLGLGVLRVGGCVDDGIVGTALWTEGKNQRWSIVSLLRK